MSRRIACICALFAGPFAAAQTTQPVDWWRLDETIGTSATDEGQNPFNGQIMGGATHVAGRVGRALQFDGVDDYVEITDSSGYPDALGNLTEGTISLWFNFATAPAPNQIHPLFYLGDGVGGMTNSSLIIEVGHFNDAKLYFTVLTKGMDVTQCFDSGYDLTPNTWYHFAAVVGPDYNTGFLNGAEMTSRHYNFGDASSAYFLADLPVRSVCWIGRGLFAMFPNQQYLNGMVDDVRIYDRPLGAAEISAYYDCARSTTDTDSDGAPDCMDGCPNDPAKVTDLDTDSDGTLDCEDDCPNDPLKTSPGACGCGTADTDTDSDGTADCHDTCPDDPDKVDPGKCGCGTADTDTDQDGSPDCHDGCPEDPFKSAPGFCGCGVVDLDGDSDGKADCIDGCPADPNKTSPGACGCGHPDIDKDSDGAPDCLDQCPSDAAKTKPGACGCGVSDKDSDSDGVPDCQDACPNDPLKTSRGVCGCGTPDKDTDSDGTPDCLDKCLNDPAKTAPGLCGCGASDQDSDSDGTPDCLDSCPNDPTKVTPGVCGCGVPETDADSNGLVDCLQPAGQTTPGQNDGSSGNNGTANQQQSPLQLLCGTGTATAVGFVAAGLLLMSSRTRLVRRRC